VGEYLIDHLPPSPKGILMGSIAVDTVNDPRQPFGLPAGSVRGFLSVLICGFFWIVLLVPGEAAKPLLAHFFLLSLVFMAFASSPSLQDPRHAVLPWFFRAIFVGVSIAVVGYAWYLHPDQIQSRLTPDPAEFKEWWMTFVGCMVGGFGAGLLIRLIFGRTNPIYLVIRSWLSVVGMVMLVIELAIFLGIAGGDAVKMNEFLRWWQAVEVVVVSAYFGTRS
jgi:hypothetical protein